MTTFLTNPFLYLFSNVSSVATLVANELLYINEINPFFYRYLKKSRDIYNFNRNQYIK